MKTALALNHRTRGTAGYVDGLAADVGSLVGDEEGHDVGNVLYPPETLERDVLREPLLHLLHRHPDALCGLLGHLRLYPTGRNRVDVDVEPAQFKRQRTGQRL